MKRIMSITLLLGLVCSLCACGGSSSFSIEGKWKNVGSDTFGQVQSGSIVAFDGKNCNVVSPSDTYAFYKDGDSYKLDCTSLLFSDTLSFTVEVVDNDHINISCGSSRLEMERAQ